MFSAGGLLFCIGDLVRWAALLYSKAFLYMVNANQVGDPKSRNGRVMEWCIKPRNRKRQNRGKFTAVLKDRITWFCLKGFCFFSAVLSSAILPFHCSVIPALRVNRAGKVILTAGQFAGSWFLMKLPVNCWCYHSNKSLRGWKRGRYQPGTRLHFAIKLFITENLLTL